MIFKEITNSPDYKISNTGKVYNKEGNELKIFLKKDGYERISLPSLKHGHRVNVSIHTLVAKYFLNNGNDIIGKQVNHIDGNKLNNNVSNLEIVTGTENVNKAHDNGLYTYNVRIYVYDKLENKNLIFRSLRELARYINKSLNYVKTRIVSSTKYPILGRYTCNTNLNYYLDHVSKIGNKKKIYVFDHVSGNEVILTSYSNIAILYGIPYTTISKKLNRNNNLIIYTGGLTISLKKLTNIKRIPFKQAYKDRCELWKKIN